MVVSLPVSESAIIVSRFMAMYATNLMLSLLITVPGIVMYGIFESPAFDFHIISLIGIIFLPLLPLTIASLMGAVITGISVRFSHKSIVEAVLSILVIGAILISGINTPGDGQSISVSKLMEMAWWRVRCLWCV